MRQTLKRVIHTFFNGKEAKNSADYRETLFAVDAWLIQNYLNHFITDIITTFAEIQDILYAPESKRSIQSVFRLQDITFYYALLLKIHLRGNIKSIASRKSFGSYYHSLVKHSPEKYRTFSRRFANTEKEEASFSFIKKATNLASNHRPANAIANAMIRMEARKIIMDGHSATKKTESKLTKIYQPIKSVLKNTITPYTWIRKYKYQYQYLLQSQDNFISDEV